MSTRELVSAVRLHGPGDVRVDNIEGPQLVEGTALVRVSWSGICGTDVHVFRTAAMAPSSPIVLGHEIAGRVAATCDDDRWPVGTRVVVDPALACRRCPRCRKGRTNLCERIGIIGFDEPGGLAGIVRVPVQNLLRLPEGLDLRVGACVEPLGCAVHAVRRAHLDDGESVVVVGAGGIGLGVLSAVVAAGTTRVIAVDPVEARRRSALAAGAWLAIDTGTRVAPHEIREATGGGAAVAFEASGTEEGFRLALECAEAGGRIVIVGVQGKPLDVDAGVAFAKELSLTWSLGALRQDLEEAVALLSTRTVRPDLWTTEVEVSQVDKGLFERMAAGAVARPLVRFDSRTEQG